MYSENEISPKKRRDHGGEHKRAVDEKVPCGTAILRK
jgi:hypothetical protein